MSVSALRPRLRSKSGCVTCRSRRKKCDETRPTCQACVRNRLSCSWNGPVHASSQTEVTVVGQNDNGINSTVSHRLSLRVADFVLENRQDDTKIPNLTEFLRRVAADVVREDGWATVPTEHVAFAVVRERLDAIRDYPQAKEMARMDLHLEACGHGQAARTAFCWLFCAMQAVSVHLSCRMPNAMTNASSFLRTNFQINGVAPFSFHIGTGHGQYIGP